MVPSPFTVDASGAHPIPPSLRIEVLRELADMAATLANKQVDGFITRLSDALMEVSKQTDNPQEAKRYAASATLLKRNRYPFYYVVSERIGASLHNEVLAAEYPGTAQESDAAPATLPPDLEVDKKLCLIKAGRAIENENSVRLQALNVRLAALLGREQLTMAQNPFRPQVFLEAIHEAWCEFQPDTSTHHFVYRVLGPALSLDLAPVLHALNMALIKRGIVPHLATNASPAVEAPLTAQEEATADDPIAQQLRRLFPVETSPAAENRPLSQDFPELFAEEAVQATASRNDLLGYLTTVQRGIPGQTQPAGKSAVPYYVELLAKLRKEAPAGALSGPDNSVIDLLQKIFRAVFDNEYIADEMKAVIGSLQVPVLKAAVQDKDFFFKPSHPARRVVDLMARLAVGWDDRKGDADPVYVLCKRSVARILQESDQRMAVFADVAQELDAFIRRDETSFEQAMAEPIGTALQQEKHQQCVQEAKNQVALRVGTGEVVAFVEAFLENKWVEVLTLAYGVKDEKPQVLDSALKTMDELCWSVKPKITAAERKELLGKLQPMIAMLNKWLDLVKWEGRERERFFKDLAACHASIVRAPLELSPERQMQIALAVAKHAAERRQQRQATQQAEPEPDQYDRIVAGLERGAWVEFRRKDGIAMKVKLAWVSPMHSLFLFSTRERQEALSISAEGLAQALREQRARIVSQPGLISRVLAAAFGTNDVAMEAKSAA